MNMERNENTPATNEQYFV